jgi:hypothetical protein
LTLKRQSIGEANAPPAGPRSAAERARAWRQRQHDNALNDVLDLLTTLPEVAIGEGLGRLTTGQLQQLGDHLLAVAVRQTRHDLAQDQGSSDGVRDAANPRNKMDRETG